MDVRLADKYNLFHAEGSVSVPLYQPIQNWDFPSILRRLGFAFFGIYGTGGNVHPSILRHALCCVWLMYDFEGGPSEPYATVK